MAAALLISQLALGCAGQRYRDVQVPRGLEPGHTVIIGFMGGRDSWRDEKVGVGRLAIRLRGLKLEGVHVQTFENTRRPLALRFVKEAFDRDRDGTLSERERGEARIILYGMSYGGAAVIKFARELEQLGVPVLLTVQVDSVGRGDEVVPANVRAAANLYQRDGKIIRGPQAIRAADPARTRILGNFRYTYKGQKVDLSAFPWYKLAFRHDHVKMDTDPQVWRKVEELILESVHQKSAALRLH